jgi:hypothetical protein
VGEEVTLAWRMEFKRSPLQVRAAVRHSTPPATPGEPERTGVEFLNISRPDRLLIVSYLCGDPKSR